MGFPPTGNLADVISSSLSSTKLWGRKTKLTFHIVCGPSLIIHCAILWLMRPGTQWRGSQSTEACSWALLNFFFYFYSQQTVFKDNTTSQAPFQVLNKSCFLLVTDLCSIQRKINRYLHLSNTAASHIPISCCLERRWWSRVCNLKQDADVAENWQFPRTFS